MLFVSSSSHPVKLSTWSLRLAERCWPNRNTRHQFVHTCYLLFRLKFPEGAPINEEGGFTSKEDDDIKQIFPDGQKRLNIVEDQRTHQSSPRAYEATWEAKSTWLPEKIIKVGKKLSLHLWSHTRTSRSVAASWASPGTQGASSWWTSQGEPVRIHRWQPVVFDDVHLDFWEVAALVAHKLGSGEHFFQSVKDIRPKEVSAKIIKVFAVGDDPLERLNLLFHRSAMVVYLVQHINYSSTEEDCGVVKVVHETEKFAFSPVQPFNCYFPPVYCQTKLSHAKGSVFLRFRH